MDAAATLRAALNDAHAVLTSGDAADAERRAKAVAALVKAERDLAEFVAAAVSEENEDALRRDLARRLDRLVRAHGSDVPADVFERIADLAHPE